MAQVTADDLQAMDFYHNEGVFCDISAKSTVDLSTMDYSLFGELFYGPSVESSGKGPIYLLLMGVG